MKTKAPIKIIAIMFAMFYNFLYSYAQTLQWTNHYQTTGINDYGADIHVGGDGRVYVCGTKGITNYNPDAMVISYTTTGTQNWVSAYGGSSGNVDEYFALTTYGTGSSIEIYATGQTNNPGTTSFDMLLVKYNQSGTQQWAASWNGSGFSSERAIAIAVDGSGNIYVCGRSSINGGDIFVLKYNSSGTLQWSQTYNSTGTQDDAPQFMKINSTGTYLYITSIRTISSTDHNTVLQKYSTSTGAISWTSVWDNTLTNDIDETYSLDIDNSENIYTVGATQTTSNGLDALMLQYNSSGILLFTNTWNNSTYNLDDVLASIDVTQPGHTPRLYVTGYTQISVANNDSDILTMHYSGTYAPPIWVSTYDGAGTSCPVANDDEGYMIMADATTGKVFVSARSYESGSNSLDGSIFKYNAGTGAQEWYALYDRGNLTNFGATKYPMDLQFDGCFFEDHIYITGITWESAYYNDATTLKYGYSGICDGPEGKVMNQTSETLRPNYGAVFPNPFNNSAVFNCNYENIINASFVIYDITGREVMRIKNINAQKFDISSKEINSGIYFYRLIQENQILFSGKIVVEK